MCTICFVLILSSSFLVSTGLNTTATCNEALGMENGYIKDDQITASSYTKLYFSFKGRRDTLPKYGRLNSDRSWCGKTPRTRSDPLPYFQVDFRQRVQMSGIAIQALHDLYWYYVKTFDLLFSLDGVSWSNYPPPKNKVWPGNTRSLLLNTIHFGKTLTARFIRIQPKTYSLKVCLRAEFYGCYLKTNSTNSSQPFTSTTMAPTPPIVTSPGITLPKTPPQRTTQPGNPPATKSISPGTTSTLHIIKPTTTSNLSLTSPSHLPKIYPPKFSSTPLPSTLPPNLPTSSNTNIPLTSNINLPSTQDVPPPKTLPTILPQTTSKILPNSTIFKVPIKARRSSSSKKTFLPILILPIIIACVLIVAILILVWRKKRKRYNYRDFYVMKTNNIVEDDGSDSLVKINDMSSDCV